VDDLKALYQRCKIAVVPIFSGSGTRIKIIEAAGYGKAIVTSSIGVEGLEMRDGHELLIRDTAEAFAASCVRLFEQPELCDRLGNAARTTAAARYDRRNVIQLIQSRIKSVVDASGAGAARECARELQ
jgi:glycosyltransferase involved in cell wall biosynthesis